MRRRNLIVGASVALVLVILVVALWPRPQRELSYGQLSPCFVTSSKAMKK